MKPPYEQTESCTLEWISVDDDLPVDARWVWVQTRSGLVALGYRERPWWITDGFRVMDSYDSVVRWAEITYPEGLKS